MARFAQYAMVASEEALQDAGWSPVNEEQYKATVWPLPFCQARVVDKQLGCLYRLWHWELR